MAAYEWGRLIGWILAPLVVGLLIYGIGQLATLRMEPMRQRRIRRGVSIGAITVTLVIAAINFSPLVKLGADDANRTSDRFLASFQRSCNKRCLERGGTTPKCTAYCECAMREVAKRMTREDYAAREMTPGFRTKMVEAARVCVEKAPPN